MAKIDDSVKKKVPELRFKGFTDEWEERKLGNAVSISSGVTGDATLQDGKYRLTRIESISQGMLNVARLGFTNEKPDQKYLLNLGDILYSNINSLSHIGKVALVDTTGIYHGINLLRFQMRNGVDSEFLFQRLNTMPMKNWAVSHANPAVSQASINQTELSKQPISSPTLTEQQQIGNFFKEIDNIIDLHQRKLDLLKEQKKGFLQKMFPKNGEKVPELRFAGFADDWEERNLGEWSDVRDGTHASPKYIKQGHPMVTSKNLTDSGLDMSDVSYLTDEDFNEINQRSKVDIGDILFGMIGTIGKPVIVDRDDFAIKNVALIKEKTSPEIINTWLIQYLKSPSFERFIQKENAGGTQKFIALGLIRDMKLMTPSVQEQARIGELLNHLDNLIVANQRKLDLLKEQKKGYLQKMFV
ncbi:MAG: restriction endonuclease subunit S [Lactococcus hircilactis]